MSDILNNIPNNIPNMPNNVNAQDAKGNTELIRAIKNKDNVIIEKLLLSPDLCINIQNNKGVTAFLKAAHTCNEKLITCMLLSKQDINTCATDNTNRTARWYIKNFRSLDCLYLLDTYENRLNYAVENNDIYTVTKLLSINKWSQDQLDIALSKVNKNYIDTHFYNNRKNIITLLLEHGADINYTFDTLKNCIMYRILDIKKYHPYFFCRDRDDRIFKYLSTQELQDLYFDVINDIMSVSGIDYVYSLDDLKELVAYAPFLINKRINNETALIIVLKTRKDQDLYNDLIEYLLPLHDIYYELMYFLREKGNSVQNHLLLITYVNNSKNINHYINDKEQTLLTFAVLNCQNPNDFLQNHANPNLTDIDGNTALHHACIHNYTACVDALLQYNNVCINITNNDGNTPLMEALIHDSQQCVELLLSNPCVSTDIKNNNNQTALLLAEKYCNNFTKQLTDCIFDITPQPASNEEEPTSFLDAVSRDNYAYIKHHILYQSVTNEELTDALAQSHHNKIRKLLKNTLYMRKLVQYEHALYTQVYNSVVVNVHDLTKSSKTVKHRKFTPKHVLKYIISQDCIDFVVWMIENKFNNTYINTKYTQTCLYTQDHIGIQKLLHYTLKFNAINTLQWIYPKIVQDKHVILITALESYPFNGKNDTVRKYLIENIITELKETKETDKPLKFKLDFAITSCSVEFLEWLYSKYADECKEYTFELISKASSDAKQNVQLLKWLISKT